MTYDDYMQSEEWQILRQIVIDRQGGQCDICGRDITQIHHKSYPKRWEDDSPDNLVGLCGRCHAEISGKIVSKSELVRQSIWDYVLVKAALIGNHYGPQIQEQCQFSPARKCYVNRSCYCPKFDGFFDDSNRNYVVCKHKRRPSEE